MWPVRRASRKAAGNSGVGACKGSDLRAWKRKGRWWNPRTMSANQTGEAGARVPRLDIKQGE